MTGNNNDILLSAADAGDITLEATADAGAGNVDLLADGMVLDGGSGAIVADGLAVRSDGFISFGLTSVVRVAADITGTGDFVFDTNGDSLEIADFTEEFGISGVTTNVGFVAITSTGALLTISGLIDAAGGTNTVSLSAGSITQAGDGSRRHVERRGDA